MTPMSALDIAKEAISRMNKRITNEVFMTIQNDRDLMQHYLRAVEKDGLLTVNQQIGKQVKASYSLTNDHNNRNDDPRSTLIQSHQEFE